MRRRRPVNISLSLSSKEAVMNVVAVLEFGDSAMQLVNTPIFAAA